ncbi:iron permease [Epithele typhae]|uniref:iron permease n=1 Tax=Epithele typhae TaxID=378194 RepID=UPI002007D317|nr:iron permease [Epithele typhae]KAH9933607.1 iron permease [Epithele typhae]
MASTTSESPPSSGSGKGSTFWLCFIALVVANFLSALDLTAVSTAVPTITNDLHGGDNFVWIGTAYGLSSTAILPFSGRLADVFGRRPTMLVSISIFLLGSALAGAAQNMTWMITARAVQGIGSGAIVNLGSIILGDLVTLAERGTYQGLLILIWALAGATGPSISGVLTEHATWRWLFYLNLPLAGVSFVLVAAFLRVRTPDGTIKEKLGRIDWIGNLIIIAGTTLALIGLTWGGIQFPWGDTHVLGALILGFILIFSFFLYETLVPKEPTIPLDVMKNRVAVSGYIATFFHGVLTLTTIFYLPVYFQACMEATPLQSSTKLLGTTLVCAPISFITGGVVKKTGKYLLVNIVGWIFMLIGFGLFTTLKADSSTGAWAGFQVLTAAGIGIIWSATVFPILASIPVHRFAAAIAFQNFLRTFAQTWGIAISASILQNELKKNLPAAFAAQFSEGVEIAYAVIPIIPGLEEPLKTEVRAAFAASMSVVWKVMTGLAGGGLLTVLLLKEVPMHTVMDDRYGLEDRSQQKLPTKGGSLEADEAVLRTAETQSSDA